MGPTDRRTDEDARSRSLEVFPLPDDLFVVADDPARPERPSPKCKHQRPYRRNDGERMWCDRCGHVFDPDKVKRGRNVRSRGNGAELVVAKAIGGKKVGPRGHPWDVEVDGYLRLQVKKMQGWPSLAKALEWIDAIPAGRELRGVIVIQAAQVMPGRSGAPAGVRGRRVVVFDLDDWTEWHGDPLAVDE